MDSLGLQVETAGFIASAGEIGKRNLSQVQRKISTWHGQNLPPFMTLPQDENIFSTVEEWKRKIIKRSEQLIVFGIGGSSLGAEMLVNGLGRKGGIPVRFYDNVDPDTLTDLDKVNWKKSFLLVVSKSGGTAETLSQFLTTLPDLENSLGQRIGKQVAVITENPEGDLGHIARILEIPIIEHPAVGGRFSALSVVGLLPAAVAGADVKKILEGAATMMKRCLSTDFNKNPALQGAAAQYLMAKSGKNISIYLSYGQRLERVAAWQSQLWGESLGKNDSKGKAHGLTPVSARGVTDQHSQLQLYLDGPSDKQYTLFYDPKSAQRGKKIGKKFRKLPAVAPLVQQTTGKLFAAEFLGTRDALIDRKLPIRTLNVSTGDAGAFGEMIILLESETVILAQFLGIDPYDQPAVEDSKVRARAYLAQS